ncbi:hypothetical protein ACM66B_003366 [Microbotryomycetes sp. NB124-2]
MTSHDDIDRALANILPFDLVELINFCFSNGSVTRIVNSATNNFFNVSTLDRHGSTSCYMDIRRDDESTWASMPLEWQRYFESFIDTNASLEQRHHLLVDLANGSIRTDYPRSLVNYLETCQRLSFDRTCAPDLAPVLRYPPTPPAASAAIDDQDQHIDTRPRQQSQSPSHQPKTLTNAMRAGQSPKKRHEVERFSKLALDVISSRQNETRFTTHVIDVGSGRAHLSRALTDSPLNLHVLAVDWSSSQTSGADYLTSIKERARQLAAATTKTTEGSVSSGSLTTRTSSLDSTAIYELMQVWPPPSPSPTCSDTSTSFKAQKVDHAPPSMLVALHACGDLTVDAIKAFVKDNKSNHHQRQQNHRHRQAILCGCCYNLMTPSSFPISSLVSSTLSTIISSSSRSSSGLTTTTTTTMRPMTRSHLRLTPNSPQTWYPSSSSSQSSQSSSSSSIRSSILKLSLRARLDAELKQTGIGTDGQRRVGKVNVNLVNSGVGNGARAVNGLKDDQGRKMKGGEMSYREYKVKALEKFKTTCAWLARNEKTQEGTRMDQTSTTDQDLEDRSVPDVVFGKRAATKLVDATLSGSKVDNNNNDDDLARLEDKDWQDALFLMQCYWTIRCWLGPVYESLCVLDRFAFLVQGTRARGDDVDVVVESREQYDKGQEGQTVELINLFDQGTGSLRNLVLVAR